MLRLIALACALLPLSAATAQEQAAAPSNSSGVVRMTPSQISAYNANFGPADPEFIKCVRMEGPGSLVKRRTCRTNADWNGRADAASDEARAIVDKIQTHGFSVSQEPEGTVFAVTPN